MILFRARTLVDSEYGDYGEWVEGFYVCFNEEEHRIYTGYAEKDCGEYYPDFVRIDPKTVRQYTGICDKNGNMIFRDDIIKLCREDYDWAEKKVYIEEEINVVKFDKGSFYLDFSYSGDGYNEISCLYDEIIKNGEVIGNIYDNPELINN